MNIGIVDQTVEGWTAGRIYTDTLVRSITTYGPEHRVVLLTSDPSAWSHLDGVECTRIPSFHTGEDLLGPVESLGLEVILPIRDTPCHHLPFAKVGWIPDFQHLQLPWLFEPDERAYRDEMFRYLASAMGTVLFSSEDSLSEFAAFAPEFRHKGRVARFPSSMVYHSPGGTPDATLEKYRLREPFVLVANQLWRHKNHLVVVQAAHILADRGVRVPFVFSGKPADRRDPEASGVSQILREIAMGPACNLIRLLGEIPHSELMDLVRSAGCIVQPSRCEGWNTTLQDAVAFGRPVVASFLPVHREQLGSDGAFFDPDDPRELADWIVEKLDSVVPFDIETESIALERHRDVARAFAESVLVAARDATQTEAISAGLDFTGRLREAAPRIFALVDSHEKERMIQSLKEALGLRGAQLSMATAEAEMLRQVCEERLELINRLSGKA